MAAPEVVVLVPVPAAWVPGVRPGAWPGGVLDRDPPRAVTVHLSKLGGLSMHSRVWREPAAHLGNIRTHRPYGT